MEMEPRVNPGRELNALVAEKVMGQTVFRNPKGGWSIGLPDYYDVAGLTELSNPLPDYSGDIASVWEVVEKLQSLGHFVSISNGHKKSCWEVQVMYVREDGQIGAVNWFMAPTVTESICNAALWVADQRRFRAE